MLGVIAAIVIIALIIAWILPEFAKTADEVRANEIAARKKENDSRTNQK